MATTLRLLRVPHGGKGAAVRAGMLDADADLIVFADADMATPPDQLPLLVAALDRPRRRARLADPARRLRHARDPAAATGGCSARSSTLLASIWVVGPVQDTQCGFKGFTRAAAHDLFARQKITSIVFDVELIYLARRRGYRIAIVPDPLVRQARLADARQPGPGRCASPGTCCASRSSIERSGRSAPASSDVMDQPALARARSRGPADRRGPRLRVVVGASRGRRPATRSASTSSPTTRRRSACSNGQPLYDMTLPDDRRLRAVLLPADVRAADPAVRAPVGDDGGLDLDRRS